MLEPVTYQKYESEILIFRNTMFELSDFEDNNTTQERIAIFYDCIIWEGESKKQKGENSHINLAAEYLSQA